MIIAVDFDDTLFEYVLPKDGSQDYSGRRDSIGRPIWYWIDWCKRRASECDQLILWTCREGIALEHAVEACTGVGLFFEAINENIYIPGQSERWPNCRKVKADLYLDDKGMRAGNNARLVDDFQCDGAFRHFTLPPHVRGPRNLYTLNGHTPYIQPVPVTEPLSAFSPEARARGIQQQQEGSHDR